MVVSGSSSSNAISSSKGQRPQEGPPHEEHHGSTDSENAREILQIMRESPLCLKIPRLSSSLKDFSAFHGQLPGQLSEGF